MRCSQFRRRFSMMTERIAVKMMQEPVVHQYNKVNMASCGH